MSGAARAGRRGAGIVQARAEPGHRTRGAGAAGASPPRGVARHPRRTPALGQACDAVQQTALRLPGSRSTASMPACAMASTSSRVRTGRRSIVASMPRTPWHSGRVTPGEGGVRVPAIACASVFSGARGPPAPITKRSAAPARVGPCEPGARLAHDATSRVPRPGVAPRSGSRRRPSAQTAVRGTSRQAAGASVNSVSGAADVRWLRGAPIRSRRSGPIRRGQRRSPAGAPVGWRPRVAGTAATRASVIPDRP